MDGNTGETAQEDLVNGVVVEDFVRGEGQAVGNGCHYLLGVLVVQGEHSV